MIQRTLVLVGPGGSGKSPLSHAFRSDLAAIDPYRMGADGPRDRNDVLYVAPRLRDQLQAALTAAGSTPQWLGGDVQWFREAKLLIFPVRDDWQLLVLAGLDAMLAKTEIYAPVIPWLFANLRLLKRSADWRARIE